MARTRQMVAGLLLLSAACAGPVPRLPVPSPYAAGSGLRSVAGAGSNTRGPRQEQELSGGEDLASQARDPTASVTAFQVRFDYTASFYGLADADQLNLVLQPIIPWTMGEQRHIARLTLPFVLSAPDLGSLVLPPENGNIPPPGFVPTEEVNGMGDLAAVDLFLFDTEWGRWGVGPAAAFPTATDPALGTEKLSLGPAAVAIYKHEELQAGTLVQTLFSVAGDSSRDDVSLLSIQPFASYGLGDGWAVGTSEIVLSYDFNVGAWTSLPLGGRVEKLVYMWDQPVRLYFDVEYNFEDSGIFPQWVFRFAFVPLLGGG